MTHILKQRVQIYEMDSVPSSFVGGHTPYLSARASGAVTATELSTLEKLTPCASELKKDEKRCNHPECKAKLGIIDRSMPCRCGHIFCNEHRFADSAMTASSHRCPFDYKTVGIKILEKANGRVVADKVEKF